MGQQHSIISQSFITFYFISRHPIAFRHISCSFLPSSYSSFSPVLLHLVAFRGLSFHHHTTVLLQFYRIVLRFAVFHGIPTQHNRGTALSIQVAGVAAAMLLPLDTPAYKYNKAPAFLQAPAQHPSHQNTIN